MKETAMRCIPPTPWLLASVCCVVFLPVNGFTHALHPESIDRYAEITITPTQILLVYELILGLNPTERAVKRLDADNDGAITEQERDEFIQYSDTMYRKKQEIMLNGQLLPLTFEIGDVYSTYGHNGMRVIKIDLGYSCKFPDDIPRGANIPFSYTDNNLTKIPGWKQMKVLCRENCSFTGHVPYEDFTKFDYEIINTRGFVPATDSIQIEISLPTEFSPAGSHAIQLPEKIDIDAIKTPDPSIRILVTILGIIGISAFVGWILYVLFRPKSTSI